MGRIAKLLSFVRTIKHGAKVSDVKVDPGGHPNITAEHFADSGDDSFPLEGDFTFSSTAEGTGRESVVGYVDPLNAPVAQRGDKRTYARATDTGLSVVQVWLKSDGSALISNDNGSVLLRPDGGTITTTPGGSFDARADGSIRGQNGNGFFELETDGDFLVNGARIDTNGNFTDGNGVVFFSHVHEQGSDSDGDSEQDTEAPKNP